MNTSQGLNSQLFNNAVYGYDIGGGLDCFGFNASQNTYGQAWYDMTIGVDPTNTDIVWTGGVDLYRSTDGGKTFLIASSWYVSFFDQTREKYTLIFIRFRWENDYATSYVHADNHYILFSPNFTQDHTMYFCNDGGLFKTSNPYAEASYDPCNSSIITIEYEPLNEGLVILQFYHGSVSSGSTVNAVGGSQVSFLAVFFCSSVDFVSYFSSEK